MTQHSERLQSAVDSGSLTIFFGAGVSFCSGLPSWLGLLQKLALKAGFDKKQCEQLKELTCYDQPTLIEERLGAEFRGAIKECVEGGRYTPAHAMLAQLECLQSRRTTTLCMRMRR